MDYLTIFSWVPKIALILLVLIGGLIFWEIFSLLSAKKKKAASGEIPQELEQAAAPLKFPQEELKAKKPSLKFFGPKTTLLLLSVLGLLFGLVTTLFVVGQRQEIRKMAQEETVSTPQNINVQCLSIKIYKVKDGVWEDLTKQLSLLKNGDEVKIAVLGSGSFNSALFKVNQEMVGLGPSSLKNPFGEFYVDYKIPKNTVDFKFEAELL